MHPTRAQTQRYCKNGRDLVLLHLDAVVATSRAKPVADNARASSAAKRRNFWPS
jgi:hypothetical protein